MKSSKEKVVAYMAKIEHIKIYEPVVINEGEGYFMRGTRVDIGSFSVVVIEQLHPNYGYFSEYMAWIKSFHIAEWKSIPVIRCSYDMTLKKFLQLHPSLKSLFKKRNAIDYILNGE